MGEFKKLKDKFSKSFLGKLIKQKRLQQISLAILFSLCIFSILITALKPDKFDLVVGQRAPSDIRASKDIEDKWETERLRENAASSVEIKYKLEPYVLIEVRRDIENFFLLLYSTKENDELTPVEKRLNLELNDLNIKGAILTTAIDTPIEKLRNLENYIYDIIAQNMNEGIKIEDLQKDKINIRDYIMGLSDFDINAKELSIALINATIRPNMFQDIVSTDNGRQEAMENIEKIMIKKGDLILREGDVVTFDRLELLRELGLLTENSSIDKMLFLGVAALTLVLVLLMIAYIYVFNKELLDKVEILLLICIIFLCTLVISNVISRISIYLMPIAASAMLLSILIDARLSLLINLCLTILIGIITGNDIIFIAMALVGGTVGVFSVLNTQQRGNIFASGIVVSLASLITIVGIGLINSNEVTKVLTFGFYGILNGVFCSILTVGSLPLWESLFSVVTPLKLLELSNPNHPLLKKLLIDAPGTYHHSIIVGNLSESAANAVGANALLARTGSFYHDVGKIARPYFFKENQLTSENPHDKINPTLSSLIITGHVKEGMELAKKYKLPIEIRNFILEHHGNTLVAFFYHKAKTADNVEEVDENQFRYNGVKPQSKETAIVMLADSIEAAVRSLTTPNKDRIEKLIQKIMKDKLEDGQLEECNITIKELEVIKRAFLQVLLGIFHERIEYPEINTKDLKGRRAYESTN